MKPKHLLTLLFLPPFLCACVYTSPRYVNGPTALNVPYFKGKQDAKISGLYSTNGSSTDSNYVHGYDLMAAYAITDHWAITMGYQFRKDQDLYKGYPRDPFDTSLVRYKRTAWQAGGGYFFGLDKGRVANIGVYGGIGNGEVGLNEMGLENNAPYSRFWRVSRFQYYLQPTFYVATKPFCFSLGLRQSWFRYGRVRTDFNDAEAMTFRLNGVGGKTLSIGDLIMGIQLRHPKAQWVALESQTVFGGKPDYHDVRQFNVSVGLTIDPVCLFKKI